MWKLSFRPSNSTQKQEGEVKAVRQRGGKTKSPGLASTRLIDFERSAGDLIGRLPQSNVLCTSDKVSPRVVGMPCSAPPPCLGSRWVCSLRVGKSCGVGSLGRGTRRAERPVESAGRRRLTRKGCERNVAWEQSGATRQRDRTRHDTNECRGRRGAAPRRSKLIYVLSSRPALCSKKKRKRHHCR